MDRFETLDLARRLDWRFLLPDPGLGRVASVGDIEPQQQVALATFAAEHRHGRVDRLADGAWDVVVVGPGVPPGTARAAFERLLRPGGWAVIELPRRASVSGRERTVREELEAAAPETIARHWFLPDRRSALRVAPLADRAAITAVLSRHGSRPARRALGGLARGLVRAGLPADAIGGDVSLVARHIGGPAVTGWPAIDPLIATLPADLVPPTPSWILLTPRFGASAHVVLLLLDDGAPRLVAKVARLAGDDGPRREGRILERLAGAGLPGGAAPRPVLIGESAGLSVLIEEAVHGMPLDRRTARGAPGRWIGAVGEWLRGLPVGGPIDVDALLGTPLRAVRDARPSDSALAGLVDRTLRIVAGLETGGVPSVFEHGDLAHPNLLVRDDGRIAVLDWEHARADGLPLHDLWFFLEYVARATGGDEQPYDGLERVLAHPQWGAVNALQAEAGRLGVGRDLLPALMVACWARTFARLANDVGPSSADPPWLSRYYRLWASAVDRQARLGPLLV